MDAVAILKNTGRVAAARGLRVLSDGLDAADGSGERLLSRFGLPTRTDLGRLARAVADLDCAADDLRHRS